MSFLRKGKRQLAKNKYKEAKKSLKKVKEVFEELEYIAGVTVLEGIELTEENIEEEVAKISNIKLGKLEKSSLLQKHYGKKLEQEKYKKLSRG